MKLRNRSKHTPIEKYPIEKENLQAALAIMTMAYITVSGIAIYDRLQLMYLRNSMKKEEY